MNTQNISTNVDPTWKGKMVLVNPKTVAWYMRPITQTPFLVMIESVQDVDAQSTPYRHHNTYGDRLVKHVIAKRPGHHHEMWEFWTIEGESCVWCWV